MGELDRPEVDFKERPRKTKRIGTQDAERKRVAGDEETEAETQVRLQEQAVRQEALREAKTNKSTDPDLRSSHCGRMPSMKRKTNKSTVKDLKRRQSDRMPSEKKEQMKMARMVADRLRHQLYLNQEYQ
jgi:hypothetical protein